MSVQEPAVGGRSCLQMRPVVELDDVEALVRRQRGFGPAQLQEVSDQSDGGCSAGVAGGAPTHDELLACRAFPNQAAAIGVFVEHQDVDGLGGETAQACSDTRKIP